MIDIFNQYFPYCALLIACAFAVVTDVRSRKIPNAIPIALSIVALAYQGCHGVMPFLGALLAIIAVLIIGSYAFRLRWIGGGDVKLLAAGCAILAPLDAMYFLFFTSISGGFLAIATAAAGGQLMKTVSSTFMLAHSAIIDPNMQVEPKTQLKMPYAIAIAAGAVSLTIMHTAIPAGLRIF